METFLKVVEVHDGSKAVRSVQLFASLINQSQFITQTILAQQFKTARKTDYKSLFLYSPTDISTATANRSFQLIILNTFSKNNFIFANIDSQKESLMILKSKYEIIPINFLTNRTIRSSNLIKIPPTPTRQSILILPQEIIFLIKDLSDLPSQIFRIFSTPKQQTLNSLRQTLQEVISTSAANILLLLKVAKKFNVETIVVDNDPSTRFSYCRVSVDIIVNERFSIANVDLYFIREFVLISRLLNKGDLILLYSPILVVEDQDPRLEYSETSILFCIPKDPILPPIENNTIQGSTLTTAATIESNNLNNFTADENGVWDFSLMKDFAYHIKDLKPKSKNFCILGRIQMIVKNSPINGTPRFGIRITDENHTFLDITCWGIIASTQVSTFQIGQTVFIENLNCSTTGSNNETVQVDCSFEDFHSKIHQISTSKGLLCSSGLRELRRLDAFEGLEDFYCRGVVFGFGGGDLERCVDIVHIVCKRKIYKQSSGSFGCDYCAVYGNQLKISHSFFLEVRLDDGVGGVDATASREVADEIIGMNATAFYRLEDSERLKILEQCIGKEFEFSISKIPQQSNEQQTNQKYRIEACTPVPSYNLQIRNLISSLNPPLQNTLEEEKINFKKKIVFSQPPPPPQKENLAPPSQQWLSSLSLLSNLKSPPPPSSSLSSSSTITSKNSNNIEQRPPLVIRKNSLFSSSSSHWASKKTLSSGCSISSSSRNKDVLFNPQTKIILSQTVDTEEKTSKSLGFSNSSGKKEEVVKKKMKKSFSLSSIVTSPTFKRANSCDDVIDLTGSSPEKEETDNVVFGNRNNKGVKKVKKTLGVKSLNF